MRKNIRALIPLIGLLLLAPFLGQTAFSADSTSIDPRNVTIKATNTSVPVGTVVAWPFASNPKDWDKWLDCNGQPLSQAAYPELHALVGDMVPDYRGLFLRGEGGQSLALGVKQNHSAYVGGNATVRLGGKIGPVVGGGTRTSPCVGSDGGGCQGEYSYREDYAFLTGYHADGILPFSGAFNEDVKYNEMTTEIPVEIKTSDGAKETRPDNKAVRYIIRAKP